MKVNLVGSVSLTLLCSGCVVGPDYSKPELPTDVEYSQFESDAASGILHSDPIDEIWWEAFQDELLVRLIEEAVESNTDIRAASARVREARSLRVVSGASKVPSIDGSSGASRSRSSQSGNSPSGFPVHQSLLDVGLAARWEIDLFGRLERGVEAASARLQASEEDRRDVLLVVISEVATSYADLRSAQRQLDVANQNVRVAQQTLELAELLHDRELADKLDVVRSRAEVTEALATREQHLLTERAATAQLAVLLAVEPKVLFNRLAETSTGSLQAPAIPIGLASDLLRRRSDVRAAERRLAAASADIGVQVAELFPRFSLTGGYGTGAASLSDLFTSPSETWSIAGSLMWPVFDGGIRRANIDVAEARYDVAFAQYDGAVYAALGDAESAFASYVYAVRENRILMRAVADRKESLELARLRFQAELDDQFPMLDAQRQLLSLESRVAQTERAKLIAAIGVFRALGGGWEVAETMLDDQGH
jgi:NodT family efflux transporter outer membrane factor (OMF) lipoprotein